MALRIHYTKNSHGLTWKSGHFYKFTYVPSKGFPGKRPSGTDPDPYPTLLLMYAFSGRHPNTGHQWRFYQGINFTHIPKPDRIQFITIWKDRWLETGGNFQLTWQTILSRYPYLKDGVRRYFYKPVYYIQNPEEIPFEKLDEMVASTWNKDFSKELKRMVHRKKAMINYGGISGFRKKRRTTPKKRR